jgi:NAD(P)H-nitrite reductase large subunit
LLVTLQGPGGQDSIECDMVACGDGLVPQTRLAQILGCEVQDGTVVVDRLQTTSISAVSCAGEPTGIGGEAVASLEGRVAGAAAGGDTALAERSLSALARARSFADRLEHTFALQATPLPPEDTMVCRCESVTLAQLRPHPDARTAKLQERCGMGACQGRVCSPALQQFLDWDRPSGRPPLFPTPLGVLTELWSEPNQCPNP